MCYLNVYTLWPQITMCNAVLSSRWGACCIHTVSTKNERAETEYKKRKKKKPTTHRSKIKINIFSFLFDCNFKRMHTRNCISFLIFSPLFAFFSRFVDLIVFFLLFCGTIFTNSKEGMKYEKTIVFKRLFSGCICEKRLLAMPIACMAGAAMQIELIENIFLFLSNVLTK